MLFLVLSWSFSKGIGQQLLFYKNHNKSVTYRAGDVISFSTREDGSRMTSQISGFEGDTLIVFKNYKINPADITVMYVDEKTMGWYFPRHQIDEILMIAGLGYPLLDLINESIINGRAVDRDVLIVGGALFGAGFLARWLISDKIKIKGRRKLLIIDP